METKHKPATPLPLKFLPDDGQFIVNAREHIVAEIPCQGVENDKQIGAYLVHTANAYPKLVEAMRRSTPPSCQAKDTNSPNYADGRDCGKCVHCSNKTLLRSLGEDQ